MTFQANSVLGGNFTAVAVAVIFALFSFGCSGESTTNIDNYEPPHGPPDLEVPSGEFNVTAAVQTDLCGLGTNYDGTYVVNIDSLGFAMGDDWTGDWSADPNTLNAHAESPHRSQTTPQGCTITKWTTVDITFTDPDAFTGQIVYRNRVVGTCACCANCASSWSITGSRATP